MSFASYTGTVVKGFHKYVVVSEFEALPLVWREGSWGMRYDVELKPVPACWEQCESRVTALSGEGLGSEESTTVISGATKSLLLFISCFLPSRTYTVWQSISFLSFTPEVPLFKVCLSGVEESQCLPGSHPAWAQIWPPMANPYPLFILHISWSPFLIILLTSMGYYCLISQPII